MNKNNKQRAKRIQTHPKEGRKFFQLQSKNLSDDLLNLFEVKNYFILQPCEDQLVFVSVGYQAIDFTPQKTDL